MKPDHERVTKLLTDTVTLLCKNGLSYDRELRIQGLLGITVDNKDIFLVSINDSFDCSSSASLTSVPSSNPSSTSPVSTESRKRPCSDIVDLTRLVETPDVRSEVPLARAPNTITPMHMAGQARPRSAGSISHSRSQASTPSSTCHVQPGTRQLPRYSSAVVGQHNANSGHGISTESSMSSNNRHINALAIFNPSAVQPGQRQQVGCVDNMEHLMLACDRHLGLYGLPRGQYPPQLSSAEASARTGSNYPTARQYMPAGSSVPSSGAAHVWRIGRSGVELFVNPQQIQRHHTAVSVAGNACAQRMEAHEIAYINATTRPTVAGNSGPMSASSRLPVPDVLGGPVYADRVQYTSNIDQMNVAMQMSPRVSNTAHFHTPARRHVAGYSPRNPLQPYNTAGFHDQLPHQHGYYQQNQPTSFSQLPGPRTDLHASNSQPPSQMSISQASVSSIPPVIKPPSSPLRSVHRSRSRQVEHIDLCGDDENADGVVDIPVSSIVIQPDNIDSAVADAEMSNTVTADNSDPCAGEIDSVPENCLPQVSHVHEIMPVDDGLYNENVEVFTGRNSVPTDNTEHLTDSLLSAARVATGPSDSGRSTGSDHLDSEELSATQKDISGDLLSTFEIGINSELARLSADESRQMAELYFDTEDSDIPVQTT